MYISGRLNTHVEFVKRAVRLLKRLTMLEKLFHQTKKITLASVARFR